MSSEIKALRDVAAKILAETGKIYSNAEADKLERLVPIAARRFPGELCYFEYIMQKLCETLELTGFTFPDLARFQAVEDAVALLIDFPDCNKCPHFELVKGSNDYFVHEACCQTADDDPDATRKQFEEDP